jgi:hypothetical protein
VPPYSFSWDNGSTNPARTVCPSANTDYVVTVKDTALSGELPRAAETVAVPLKAIVGACRDGGVADGGGVYTVPGISDIWLAGQPDGAMLSQASGTQADVAPTNSPVEVPVVAGSTLTFSASGSTSYTGGVCSAPTPDGGCLLGDISLGNNAGPANGISSIQVIADALVGVFLDSSAPGGTAPPALNFTSNTGFTTLSPVLRQVFFIGDGLTGTGTGGVQEFVVPAGATRLFLASSDAAGASYNNSGTFSVLVSAR